MTTVRSTVNQQVQIGPEATPGTAVACGKLLTAFTWTLGPKVTTKQFRGTGRQYASASAELTSMSAGKISGPGDFGQLIYPFSSLWGSGSPALHSPSTTVYDWIWTPGVTGSYAANAKTFTLQVGDAVDVEQYTYLTFTGFNYSFGRKQEVMIGADFMAQTFTDGASLTATPTVVEQVPMVGAQMDIYLDSTSSGIGTTKLTDVMKCEYKASGYYDGYWPVNRADTSFSNLLDKEKTHTLELIVQANSTGVGYKATYLDVGARCYVQVKGTGPVLDSGNALNAAMTHQMACFVTNMAEFADEDGVYAVKYSLVVAEDSAWNSGEAQKMTLSNLVSAL